MRKLITLLNIVVLTGGMALAQDGPPPHILKTEQAVIEFLRSNEDSFIDSFVDEFWATDAFDDRSELVTRLTDLRNSLKPYLDGVGIEGEPGGLLFMLSNDNDERKNLLVQLSPDGIIDMREVAVQKEMIITKDNLDDVVDSLESIGMAGLLYIRDEGEEIINQPFGMANPDLNIPNKQSTIFGIGSRPIDFTVAGILLLNKQGKLSLSDPITKFFDQVPADRQGMTITHLMNGESGLPDFFETVEDWNPDLAWIDRETAEQRMLSIPLIFEPGTGQQHSHAAFVMLAAIIEHVSGQEYYSFIRTHFLDPAGMGRTGEYGETRGLSIEDFAVGGGPEKVGLPNIPPNWGKTSWLVKGSGGMYSTLGDLRNFYEYVRSGEVFDEDQRKYFQNLSVNVDGSMRGFELFSISDPGADTEVYLFINNLVDRRGFGRVTRALERFILD